jgi:hypothetical protein
MRPRLQVLGAALVAGCAGAALAFTNSSTSPAAPGDAFECLRDQLKKEGFRQTSYDTEAMRVGGQKFNESVRRPDVRFRRLVDRVTFQVGPEADGTTKLTAEAATFAELATHRGPTEEQEKTSETARAAADTLLKRCSAPVDSSKVPG